MASDSSFDIEAGVDRQEVDNAINQAAREVSQRFDFKGTDSSVAWAGDEGVTIESSTEDRVLAAVGVFEDKCVKRKVSLKALDVGEPRAIGGNRYRVDVGLTTTLPQDLAKRIVKDVKAMKSKVTPTNMGDRVRVASRKRDELQAVQAMVREQDYDAPIRFANYQ